MKNTILILALLFHICVYSQEQSYTTFNLGSSTANHFHDGEEVPSLRTEKTETRHFQNSKVVIKNSSHPIHFFKNGHWEKINLNSIKIKNGNLYPNQTHPIFIDEAGKITFDVDSKNAFQYIPALSKTAELKDISEATYILESAWGNQKIQIKENAAKSSFFIPETPEDLGEDVFLKEQYLLPEGAKIEYATGRGKLEGETWYGALIISGLNGECIGTIGGAICIDAANKFNLAGYHIGRDQNVWTITTVVQRDWLLQEERTFPVEVDPLITGPTSLWSNGYMPSCFMPNYNVDSMLVSIPGGITVTGLLVGASYYADPFTSAWMSDGSMYFSTSCGQTEEFTVTGANASLAGTAYLENFDMRNPLMCCYSPTCADQSFYLRMHLGRSYINDGCNTNYIYYDMFTQWPFVAYVEGHTIESYGSQWTVPTAVKCTNDCNVTGTVRMRYGVPPYTITHPWMQASVVVGEPEPCDLGNTAKQIELTIPNCPEFCNTSPTLSIPAPTVVDACGNLISGMPPATLNRKPTPNIQIAPLNLVVCNNESYDINLSSCLSNATITWGGNGNVSFGSFTDQFFVSDTTAVGVSYNAFADLNGCYSDTVSFVVQVLPTPQANFIMSQNPVVVSQSEIFTDESVGFGSNISEVNWNFGDGEQSSGFVCEHVFDTPGIYMVCETITTENNCLSETCQELLVVPATIQPMNIITPNGDGKNDYLAFDFIEFYPENHLLVFNRWGNIIFESHGYTNTWNGSGFSDGTYYYVLDLKSDQSPIESDLLIKRD